MLRTHTSYLLANLRKHTQKKKLKNHLDHLFPNNNFLIEEHYQFKYIKIFIEKSYKDDILREDIWPERVEVSEYDFFGNSKNTRVGSILDDSQQGGDRRF